MSLPETAEKTELLTQQLMAFVWKELYLFLKKELLTLKTASFALISSLGAVTSDFLYLFAKNPMFTTERWSKLLSFGPGEGFVKCL